MSYEPPPFFTEFLDDFFAECDEHLTLVQRRLLDLDGFVGRPKIETALIDELLRAFHTLKGLSGMVGLHQSEQLAHAIESYLRALRGRQLLLTSEGIEALSHTIHLMIGVIAAFRAKQPLPDIQGALDRLAALPNQSSHALAPRPPATLPDGNTLTPDERSHLVRALEEGGQFWRFVFTPSAELIARGINVNLIRSWLQEAGALIRVLPLVTQQGSISFEFLFAGAVEAAMRDRWQAEGLVGTPYDLLPLPVDEPSPVIERPATPTLISNIVRVDLGRLDEIMQGISELMVSRAQLDEQIRQLSPLLPASHQRPLRTLSQQLARQLRDLRLGVMRTRLVPIGELFARMQFVVRDLTREQGKQVRLELHGQESEIDKFVIERLAEPLLHLVRNAVSHGLEEPQVRVQAGKMAEGRLSLCASVAGDRVTIEIEDDGRGIDLLAVQARAEANNLIPPGTTLSEAEVLDILCLPGFSTRQEADRASGRGVGMDVVCTVIHELGGTIRLETVPGHGTRFSIHLLVTLAVANALLVQAGGQLFAIPLLAVEEVIQLDGQAIVAHEEHELVVHRGRAIPLRRLTQLFRLPTLAAGAGYALVVGDGLTVMGLVVERIVSQREIVVRALQDPLVRVPGITGATELGDGRIALIVDPTLLVQPLTADRRP